MLVRKLNTSNSQWLKYILIIPFVMFLLLGNIIAQVEKEHEGQIEKALTKRKRPERETPIFKVVEKMPIFPGCEDKELNTDRVKCSNERLKSFIYDNLRYPKQAMKEMIEGTVMVSFIVEMDGSITDTRVVRKVGGGCDEEALRIIKMMPKWIPGTQRGNKVRVQINKNINFRIPSLTEEQGAQQRKKKLLSFDSKGKEVFTRVERMPLFPGGKRKIFEKNRRKVALRRMSRFIHDNLKYPEQAKKSRLQGKVLIGCVVDTDGTLYDIEILKDIGGGCGEEALRIVKMMPKWIPGQKEGKNVRVKIALPIFFSLGL